MRIWTWNPHPKPSYGAVFDTELDSGIHVQNRFQFTSYSFEWEIRLGFQICIAEKKRVTCHFLTRNTRQTAETAAKSAATFLKSASKICTEGEDFRHGFCAG